jgi:GNAT superfamily N-acetyltransferase
VFVRQPDVFSDRALACRLERTEANANARFVDARARLAPDSDAQWIEVAGVQAMYDGPSSPCTQTFGLGLFRMPTAAEMDALEAFFRDRGAPVLHEVSPMADRAVLDMLYQRGYRPVEFTSVLFRPLSRVPSNAGPSDLSVSVRQVGGEEQGLWARTAVEGWREISELAEFMPELMRAAGSAEDSKLFLAELDGRAIAAAALSICAGVALLAGASTIPEWRKRGAQRALLESRLAYAAGVACDLAMICAEPGGASQRNAERQGFRIAYTRVKWELPLA